MDYSLVGRMPPLASWDAASLSTGLQQLPCMFEACLSQLRATQHTCHLAGPFALVHPPNTRSGPPGLIRLLNQEMLICKGCDLRQVRDADHLLPLRQGLQLPSHSL